MEGTYDIPYKKERFFVTTEPNRMGLTYKFTILKAIDDEIQIVYNLGEGGRQYCDVAYIFT